jgi:hypothetical protein
MNILITAANSAEAHKLKNQLKADNIILGDYQELPAFMLKSANMIFSFLYARNANFIIG